MRSLLDQQHEHLSSSASADVNRSHRPQGRLHGELHHRHHLQCVVSVARQPAPVNGDLFCRMKGPLIRSASRACWSMSYGDRQRRIGIFYLQRAGSIDPSRTHVSVFFAVTRSLFLCRWRSRHAARTTAVKKQAEEITLVSAC